jgi:hypothetical protein
VCSTYLRAGPGQEESEHHPVYPGVPESGQRIQRGGEGQNFLQGNCKISHILIVGSRKGRRFLFVFKGLGGLCTVETFSTVLDT